MPYYKTATGKVYRTPHPMYKCVCGWKGRRKPPTKKPCPKCSKKLRRCSLEWPEELHQHFDGRPWETF